MISLRAIVKSLITEDKRNSDVAVTQVFFSFLQGQNHRPGHPTEFSEHLSTCPQCSSSHFQNHSLPSEPVNQSAVCTNYITSATLWNSVLPGL